MKGPIKYQRAIMAIVQVPRGHSEKIEMPVGEYLIEYAQGDGVWQGLGEFWGYGTHFNKSRLHHSVYQEIIRPQRIRRPTRNVLKLKSIVQSVASILCIRKQSEESI